MSPVDPNERGRDIRAVLHFIGDAKQRTAGALNRRFSRERLRDLPDMITTRLVTRRRSGRTLVYSLAPDGRYLYENP